MRGFLSQSEDSGNCHTLWFMLFICFFNPYTINPGKSELGNNDNEEVLYIHLIARMEDWY